jgi:hypothetical protein
VEAKLTVTCAEGSSYTRTYRLVTTLLDHHRYPAAAVIALHHERWEHESAYYALRHTILDRRVLRSKDPAGVEQEMWGLLTVYQILRTAMVSATESVPGTDPDRASFTVALHTAREQLTNAANVLTETVDLVGHIGRQTLAQLLPARRLPVSTRKVKSPLSRYAKSTDNRPATTQEVTSLTITIQDQPSTRHRQRPPTTHRQDPDRRP